MIRLDVIICIICTIYNIVLYCIALYCIVLFCIFWNRIEWTGQECHAMQGNAMYVWMYSRNMHGYTVLCMNIPRSTCTNAKTNTKVRIGNTNNH